MNDESVGGGAPAAGGIGLPPDAAAGPAHDAHGRPPAPHASGRIGAWEAGDPARASALAAQESNNIARESASLARAGGNLARESTNIAQESTNIARESTRAMLAGRFRPVSLPDRSRRTFPCGFADPRLSAAGAAADAKGPAAPGCGESMKRACAAHRVRSGTQAIGASPQEQDTMSENEWPKTRMQQVDWLLARISDWTANAADIGLDPTQVSAFSAALTQVQTARDDALATRTLAKGKTQTFYGMADPVIETAGGMIKTIRGYAATSGEPNVWELAHIDPPAAPSPTPAPTTPTDIVTSLHNDGSIVITWTAKNAAPNAGTAFTVHRKLEGQASYTPIATVGVRTFTDETVPPGTPSVQYMIRGIRGDKVGQFSEAVTVYLGKTPMNGEEGGLSLAA